VRVDVLSGRWSPKARAWVDLVGGLALLLPFSAFAAWTTGEMAVRSALIFEGSPDPGGLPRWPIKLLIPFAFGLLALQGLAEVRGAFARARARA
jgi:TRAP-type mannitol/chloroaromatic compound transport system permease small subunit